jgi:PAS domain S-box-containing protein
MNDDGLERLTPGLLDHSFDGILAYDRDCRVTLWNPAMERISGLKREEALGRCAFDLLPFLRETDEARLFQEALSGREVASRDRPYVGADGTRGFFEARYAPLRGPSGEIVGGLAIVRDITIHKEVDEALRESEERFSKAFRCNPDSMVITRLEDGTIIEVNQGFERLTGYRRTEVVGRTSADLHLWKDRADRARILEELRHGGGIRGREVAFRTKSGQEGVELCSAEMIDLDGEPCVLWVSRDITQRKEREESLRRLSGRLLTLQDEERRRIARDLHDGTGQNLAALVMNLNRMKKLESGRRPARGPILAESLALTEQCLREIRTVSYLLHPPLLDEVGLLSAIRWYVRGFAERSGIKVRLKTPQSLRRLPREMETALFRILQESLTNILRHAGSPTARIGLALDGEEVVLEVGDRGAGMPAGFQEHAGGAGASLGVGIPGMRERVRQLGGRLQITSGRHGTTVRALLPLRAERRPARKRVTASRRSVAAPGKEERV